MTRTMPCACGGTIVAGTGAETEAVAEHNETWQHLAWRRDGGMWAALSREADSASVPTPDDVAADAALVARQGAP